MSRAVWRRYLPEFPHTDLADTSVLTIRNHYRHLLPDLAAHVEEAIEIEWGPGDLGMPELVPVKPNPKLVTPTQPTATAKPTRRQLEGSDRLARNAHASGVHTAQGVG